jgi:hypothetical protein
MDLLRHQMSFSPTPARSFGRFRKLLHIDRECDGNNRWSREISIFSDTPPRIARLPVNYYEEHVNVAKADA